MILALASTGEFPRPLTAYPSPSDSLLATLSGRIAVDPFNAVATTIFVLAILHTFATAKFVALAHRIQKQHDLRATLTSQPSTPSVSAELLHFLGEVEVVFGLWAVLLLIAIMLFEGWETAKHYLNSTVNYTEALFVVVIMALASTRPIIGVAEAAMRRVVSVGGATPAAWWFSILTIGPLLGSFITEPAAMTICALLLARQFFDLRPSVRLKFATLGLLFVNVSIGGTLTHFAAPPVLMVSRAWEWGTPFMMSHFGWRAAIGVVASTLVYYMMFRRELRGMALAPPVSDVEQPEEIEPAGEELRVQQAELLPVPAWVTFVHVLFIAWTVLNSHYPALFLGGFLLFLGFVRATAPYQTRVDLRAPVLVGFFLAGLVIHGGLQGWWIAPVLGSLRETPLFFSAALLTAFNDNALITYLSTLVPGFAPELKVAVVAGAVTGGGLTVIANAPNPAGQALLARFFGGAIPPLGLFAAALIPTLIAVLAFRML